MLKYRLIRMILRLITFPVFVPNKSPILVPKEFSVFYQLPEDTTLKALIKGYQQVFGESPWEEKWKEEVVLTKLKRELSRNSFLVIMDGNKEWPVGGFSWGAIIPIEDLENRVRKALGSAPKGLIEVIKHREKGEKILYFDEFSILRPFRRGVEPIRFLLRPGLEMGAKQGVFQTLFWSTPESRIVPLSIYMGYEPIILGFQPEEKKKRIIFMYNPNFTSLLKITQKVRGVVRIMKIISSLTS